DKAVLVGLVTHSFMLRDHIVAESQPCIPDTDYVKPDTEECEVQTVVRSDKLKGMSLTNGVIDRTDRNKWGKGSPIGSALVNHYTVKDTWIPRYGDVETVRCRGTILEIDDVGGEASAYLCARRTRRR